MGETASRPRKNIGGISSSVREFVRYIPSGDTIPKESWRARHRNLLILLFAHIPFLFALGLYEGTDTFVTGATIPATPLWRIFVNLGVIAGLGLLALLPQLSRRKRTALSSLGVVVSSVTLVFFSGGLIEAHFHFFVALAYLALYEDWLPFALGFLGVGISHVVFGVIDASRVYNHVAALENPMVWGGIHAVFVGALTIGLMSQWYSTEKSRERVQQQLAEVERKRDEIDNLEKKKAEVEEAKAKAEKAQKEAQAKQAEVERLNEQLEATADAYSEQMARAAEGDLTVRLDADNDSAAMNKIGESFNGMATSIESTMEEIQEFAGQVAIASDETGSSVSEVQRASEDVSESIQQIAEGTDEQRDMLQTVSNEMTSLSATIEEVAASAETVAQTSDESQEVAQDGERTAQEAAEDVREIQAALDKTVQNITELDDRMDEIGEIIELISDIAEQTNMLALNANIEAARASGNGGSESGDGFAVVAAEVKQLAEETQTSANEIEQLIERTQAQTAETVEEAEAAHENMDEGVEAVVEAADAFKTVRENAAEANAGIREISDAADEQAATAEEVASMATEVADIGEENADESASVSAAAEEQASSMTQINSSVGNLNDQAKNLQRLLSEFTVSGTSSTGALSD